MKAWQILKAIEDGKELQCKGIKELPDKWCSVSDITNWRISELHKLVHEWRIKPVPREWNLGVNEHGTLFITPVLENSVSGLRPILVREVLED